MRKLAVNIGLHSKRIPLHSVFVARFQTWTYSAKKPIKINRNLSLQRISHSTEKSRALQSLEHFNRINSVLQGFSKVFLYFRSLFLFSSFSTLFFNLFYSYSHRISRLQRISLHWIPEEIILSNLISFCTFINILHNELIRLFAITNI